RAACPCAETRPPANRALAARHDLQERRLARAVRAEDADLRARQERQPDPLQDLPVRRIDLPQVPHRVDELLAHALTRGTSSRATRDRRMASRSASRRTS